MTSLNWDFGGEEFSTCEFVAFIGALNARIPESYTYFMWIEKIESLQTVKSCT